MAETYDVPGSADVVRWFGYWPTFHDAEVLSISLNRASGCQVAIHTWENTREVDARGYYVPAKHAVVTFFLEGFPMDEEGITNTRIEYFNHQNVLGGAWIEKREEGYELVLWGIYGVAGRIACERMKVMLQPGKPT